MLYVLSGQDEFSVTGALEGIKKSLFDRDDPATLAMSTTALNGKNVSAEDLMNICHTVPFLSGKRLVIIDGLIERFEPRNRPRRQAKTKRQDNEADRHKPFAAALGNLPESTVTVLVEGEISAGNPLLKELAGQAVVKTFQLIKGHALDQWILDRVGAEGEKISPRAANLLARLVGSDLRIMASEIDKLILFARGRQIEEKDVSVLVGYSEQGSIFTLIDAVLDFKADFAERTLQQLLRDGDSPSHILTMLARQAQLIVRAKELKEQRLPNSEMQTMLSLRNEFAFRKTLEQAARHSLVRMKDVYHRLLETDLSIKTGRFDAELALTILVAELARRDLARSGVSG